MTADETTIHQTLNSANDNNNRSLYSLQQRAKHIQQLYAFILIIDWNILYHTS